MAYAPGCVHGDKKSRRDQPPEDGGRILAPVRAGGGVTRAEGADSASAIVAIICGYNIDHDEFNMQFSFRKIRRDKAARGVQGGGAGGPPGAPPPPLQLLRGVAAENLPVDNSKKRRRRRKEEGMEKNHRRGYKGKEDDIKSPAAALLEGRSQEEWHRMLVQMW